MKSRLIHLALITLTATTLHAQSIPLVISYQGRVLDSASAPVGDSAPVNRKMAFALYDAPTAGTLVWAEQQFVNISGGDFSVLLGNGAELAGAPRVPLDKLFGSGVADLYLQVTVDTGNSIIDLANTAEDPPILPRQRLVSSGFAFRAQSMDSITPGGDLRFLPSEDTASGNFGLGHYSSFGGSSVSGPVLFGQGGGGLGTSASGNEKLTVSWLSNGYVGIGTAAPTERLEVAGNVKASGGIGLGGAVTSAGLSVGNLLATSSLSSSGPLTAGPLLAGSLTIKPVGTADAVASISSTGVIDVTKGGSIVGTNANPLTITSSGKITVRELQVTGSFTASIGGASTANVLTAAKRLVLGGATGWDDNVSTIAGAPVDGANSATGMRVILSGTSASTDLIGYGLSATNKLFAIAPPSDLTQWFGGTTAVMTLNNSNGLLSTGPLSVGGSWNSAPTPSVSVASAVARIEGSSSARLQLTNDNQPITGSRHLALTNSSDGKASLGWLKANNGLVPLLTFKRSKTDAEVSDQVPDLGFVGINTTNPKAPLHVTQAEAYNDDAPNFTVITAAPTVPPGDPVPLNPAFSVFLGVNGGVAGAGGVSAFRGDNHRQRYEFIAAIFEGDVICNRHFFGIGLDTSSDARAKQILGMSDTAQDLATLMKLEVTDYRWIDRNLDGYRPHKRLIAQQVQSVFPQAVSISPMPKPIPSVYEMAAALKHDAKAQTLTITTKKAHDFKVGDRVDLFGDKTEMKETKVNAVVDEHRFVITCAEAPKSLFVYGKHVSDFHTVDYDAVSMLHLSATQEIKKQNDKLAAENTALKAQLKAQQGRRAALQKERATADAKFAALAALIQQQQRSAKIQPAVLNR